MPGTHRFIRAPRFTRLAPQVDPNRAGYRFTVVPAALTALISGRGGLAASRLLTLYHREQKIRCAIQVPDEVAAWRLGCKIEQVKTARKRLERLGIVELVRPAMTHEPAVYVIPGAHPRAEARPQELDPERTRYLLPLELGAVTTTTYASVGERALLAARAAEALDYAEPGEILNVLRRASGPVIAKAPSLSTLPASSEGRLGTAAAPIQDTKRTNTERKLLYLVPLYLRL